MYIIRTELMIMSRSQNEKLESIIERKLRDSNGSVGACNKQ